MGGKVLEHQNKLFHYFIDFKKAFDRVWHDSLLRVLTEYTIATGCLKSSGRCTMKRPAPCY